MHSIKYLETILRDTGATLRFFDHGRDAINFLRSEDNIDVVLMDIRLPDIDGITATKLIREFNTRVPIIAQTAYASNEDKLKCLRSGCNYHVPKPINRNQLISVIDAIIRKK
jgi:CheY-like chemotaxis protein